MRLVGRVIWVAVAAILSGVISMGVAGLVGLELLTRASIDVSQSDDPTDAWFRGLDQLTSIWPLFRSTSLLPLLALLIVGEVMRIRSAAYYTLGAAIGFLVLPGSGGWHAGSNPTASTPLGVWQTLAVAGLAGGATYWLLAGRKA
jgi:hypothetical protein